MQRDRGDARFSRDGSVQPGVDLAYGLVIRAATLFRRLSRGPLLFRRAEGGQWRGLNWLRLTRRDDPIARDLRFHLA